MKATTWAVFVMFLAVSAAHAQQAQNDRSTKAQTTTPISGIDDAALAGSARASKLIGSKVYKRDTSIGQIEDLLVDLDHASVTAVILSVGGFLGIGDKLVAVPVNQLKGWTRGKIYDGSDKGAACQRASFRLRQAQIADRLSSANPDRRGGSPWP